MFQRYKKSGSQRKPISKSIEIKDLEQGEDTDSDADELWEELNKSINASKRAPHIESSHENEDESESESESESDYHSYLIELCEERSCTDEEVAEKINSLIQDCPTFRNLQGYINIKKTDGTNALMILTERGFVKSMQVILSNLGEVNDCDNLGITALMRAAKLLHVEAIQLLLDEKADIHIRSYAHESAFDYLVSSTKKNIESKNSNIIDFKKCFKILSIFKKSGYAIEKEGTELIPLLKPYANKDLHARACLSLLNPSQYVVSNSIFKFRTKGYLHLRVLSANRQMKSGS
ncbi:MAG TPA: ankyrin repeat domain-containing protein [Gammaproteobacteria bacterium]|jgi:ankyrin repeat protein|nr:ankyrin repeat domain-containing protein [Gammaproteobacteria bacterium]